MVNDFISFNFEGVDIDGGKCKFTFSRSGTLNYIDRFSDLENLEDREKGLIEALRKAIVLDGNIKVKNNSQFEKIKELATSFMYSLYDSPGFYSQVKSGEGYEIYSVTYH